MIHKQKPWQGIDYRNYQYGGQKLTDMSKKNLMRALAFCLEVGDVLRAENDKLEKDLAAAKLVLQDLSEEERNSGEGGETGSDEDAA